MAKMNWKKREAAVPFYPDHKKEYKPKPKAVSGKHCPKCDGPMCERSGKNGTFLSCMGYPHCNGTARVDQPRQEPVKKPVETHWGSYQLGKDLRAAVQAVKPDEPIWAKFGSNCVEVYVENWHPELLSLWVDAVRSVVKPPTGQELTQINFHHFTPQAP